VRIGTPTNTGDSTGATALLGALALEGIMEIQLRSTLNSTNDIPEVFETMFKTIQQACSINNTTFNDSLFNKSTVSNKKELFTITINGIC
jgi:hypothetical protein